MKKIALLFAVLFFVLLVQAQPPMGGMSRGGMGGMGMGGMAMGGMGGFSQPFYMTESDSIASELINKSSAKLNLTEKQIKKMIKLFSQEYQEECRIIQMSVMESQMTGMGGFGRYGGGMNMPVTNTPAEPQGLDTLAVKNNIIEIGKKYDKRYGKILGDEKAAQWKKMEDERKDKEFLNFLGHVSENTESFF